MQQFSKHKLQIFYFFILCLVCTCLLGISSCSFFEDSKSLTDSIISFENFSEDEYFIETGDTQTFSISISPKNIELSDIVISASNPDIIDISEPSIKNGWKSSKLTFKVVAASAGTSSLSIMSADGSVCSNEVVFTVEEPTKVTSFGTFNTDSVTIFTGETYEISWRMYPRDLDREDIEIISTNNSIISIKESSFSTYNNATRFTFKVTGLSSGVATIFLQSSNGKLKSESLTFIIETPPVIQTFGKFSQTGFHLNIGDTYTFTQNMLPAEICRDDFSVIISDDSVISIVENSLTSDGDATIFNYTVKALSEGQATLILKSSDGKTSSQILTFYITAKDTSRTVYITPTGSKYHFSLACAGENGTPTTLNSAKEHGYSACAKCAT